MDKLQHSEGVDVHCSPVPASFVLSSFPAAIVNKYLLSIYCAPGMLQGSYDNSGRQSPGTNSRARLADPRPTTGKGSLTTSASGAQQDSGYLPFKRSSRPGIPGRSEAEPEPPPGPLHPFPRPSPTAPPTPLQGRRPAPRRPPGPSAARRLYPSRAAGEGLRCHSLPLSLLPRSVLCMAKPTRGSRRRRRGVHNRLGAFPAGPALPAREI